jgi:hypothetical protein
MKEKRDYAKVGGSGDEEGGGREIPAGFNHYWGLISIYMVERKIIPIGLVKIRPRYFIILYRHR